jgi:hypothetical protein
MYINGQEKFSVRAMYSALAHDYPTCDHIIHDQNTYPDLTLRTGSRS